MAYTLTNWTDSPSPTTPLSSVNLTRANTAISDLDSRVTTVEGGVAAVRFTPTLVKTANYTAAAADFVPVDTTSGAVTITLPTAPADGSLVAAKLIIQGGTNTVTVAAGGSDVFNKAGGSTTYVLRTLHQSVWLQYKHSAAIWYVVTADVDVTSLDARYLVNLTAADSTITVAGGTTLAPTVKVNAIAESQVTNLTTDLAAKAPLASPTLTGTTTVTTLSATTVGAGTVNVSTALAVSGSASFTGSVTTTPDALTDAATILVNAALGNHFRVTLGASRTMGAPSNPTDGQLIKFEIIQDAGGSRAITWTGGAGGYAFGADIPAPVLTITPNLRDFVGFIYNSTANLWYCLAVARGY